MQSFDQLPDSPRSFGYKVSWFAVRASDPASVVDALAFGDATAANWASGLAAVYARESDPWLFVSPPVEGWIFLVGSSLPYPVTIERHRDIGEKFDLLLSRLMSRFDDVQFFGSHRVADFVTWARALKGQPVRIFAYADGEVLANIGAQTPEEAKLGFADLSGLSPFEACDKIFRIVEEQVEQEEELIASGLSFEDAQARIRQAGRGPIPDEEDVTNLAALWSIDPVLLEGEDHRPGTGLVLLMPKTLAQ